MLLSSLSGDWATELTLCMYLVGRPFVKRRDWRTAFSRLWLEAGIGRLPPSREPTSNFLFGCTYTKSW